MVTSFEGVGDKVVVAAGLETGKASGVGGEMPVAIVFTLADGLVTNFDWYRHPADARRAAGLA